MSWNSDSGQFVAVLDAQKTKQTSAQTIQGRVQRVNYRSFELTVVADGTVRQFTLTPDCAMWFNDSPAILRCFHPLDPVTVVFDDSWTARALFAWEPGATRQAQAQSYRIAV